MDYALINTKLWKRPKLITCMRSLIIVKTYLYNVITRTVSQASVWILFRSSLKIIFHSDTQRSQTQLHTALDQKQSLHLHQLVWRLLQSFLSNTYQDALPWALLSRWQSSSRVWGLWAVSSGDSWLPVSQSVGIRHTAAQETTLLSLAGEKKTHKHTTRSCTVQCVYLCWGGGGGQTLMQWHAYTPLKPHHKWVILAHANQSQSC